jgi:hypothetical protein
MNDMPSQDGMIGKREQGRYIINAYQKLFSISVSKTWAEIFQLEAFFNRYHFDQIVELGTGSGATTIFMGIHSFMRNAQLYTFDTKPIGGKVEELFQALNILWYTGDIFQMVDRIAERIQRKGRTLLYLDNGNKRKEMETWGKFLKSGDIALLHDYGEEVHEIDINRYCDEFKMERLDYEWFMGFTGMHVALIKK